MDMHNGRLTYLSLYIQLIPALDPLCLAFILKYSAVGLYVVTVEGGDIEVWN